MDNNGFIGMVEKALKSFNHQKAFADFDGDSFTYNDAAKRINSLHKMYNNCGIKKGDKIALIGRNLSNYTISYLSVVTYGAVVVPILPDFGSSEIHHIVNHSESKLLFSTEVIFNKIDEAKMPNLKGIISIDKFVALANGCDDISANSILLEKLMQEPFEIKDLKFDEIGEEELMVLSYTSGTSGFSKGVMIPHRSIWSNVKFAQDKFDLTSGERIVSFLPLAHAYGCLFEFLWPFTVGCEITLLSRVPSPKIITEAFQKIKPHLILAVPLILEKIFKKRIQPALEKGAAKTLVKVPLLNQVVFSKVKNQLVDVFGGEFREIIIGGAALNKDVEDFLRKIGFPFTIGYGMTECGPLISYEPYKTAKPRSAGRLVDRMEVRIDSKDPYNEVGEILVKGDNNMLGYFKNSEATAQTIDAEGWIHTGDLGVIDAENFIFIKGRSKNMILSGSGQNIYPEEIETKLCSMDYVQECLVRDMGDGKLEALVYPDFELADAENIQEKELSVIIADLKNKANAELPAYMNLSKVTEVPEEFDKTPKKSIKRYKYI
ncbi:AMP-binding protein [Saccharicrinis aurantiacus]|uniref:AMP-binding protein n=1 Tax=Saccharicrinis aurantiacus TaxID=1849719 RepID=UPI002493346D|nr:AMP-binding protein [Saccharicrinis aurantiacus]